MQKFARVVEHNDVQILITAEWDDDAVPLIKLTWVTTDKVELDLCLRQVDESLTDEAKDKWLAETLASDGVVQVAHGVADKVTGLDMAACAAALTQGDE